MKKYFGKIAWMIFGAVALLLVVFGLGWADDYQIWRTNKRVATREKLQNLRLKDAYGDGLEEKTGTLIERARSGRDVNDRYNSKLEKYNNEVNGVGNTTPPPVTNTVQQNNNASGCYTVPASNLPETPTRIWSEETTDGTRYHWPVNAPYWVKLTQLKRGQTVTADPSGFAWHNPCMPNMGPAGEPALSAVAKWLPAPAAGAGALVAKLGENGQPTALTGPLGHPLTATEDVDLYVFINDFFPGTNIGHGAEIGSADNKGDLPVYIK